MSRLQNRVERLEEELTPQGTPFFLLIFPDGTCQAQGVRYANEEEAVAANPDINSALCIKYVTHITRSPGEVSEYYVVREREASKLGG